MDLPQFETGGGVRVTRTATTFDPAVLAGITQQVEARRGGVLSSGMEYPGRYSRWHMAYVDPCIELIARGRRVTAAALNDRGRVLLPVIAAAIPPAREPPHTACPAPPDTLIAALPGDTPDAAGRHGPGRRAGLARRVRLWLLVFPPTRGLARSRPWSSRPGSASPAATCSRWCRAMRSTPRATRRAPSTSGCGSATPRRTSSSSTWGRTSTWSGPHRRCTCG